MAKLSVDKALLKAKSHAKKGEVEEAQKLYQAVLNAFPKNKRAQQGLTALNKPQPSISTHIPSQDTINHLLHLYNTGQLAAAVEQAKALTQQYPEAFVIWNILGAANKGLGRVEEASSAFNNALCIRPDSADALYNLGVALQDQGKLEEAVEAYNKALAIKPDYVDAYYNLGNALKTQGKLEEAIKAYNKVISSKPDYVDAYNNMGNALQDQGKIKEAIEAYNKVLSIRPDSADVYLKAIELLKILPIKSTKSHGLFSVDKQVKKIGSSLLSSASDKEIALKLTKALNCISEKKFSFKTPLSQIYKANSIDLNCARHTKIFNSKNIISEFCFGCFKVQVEVIDLFSLIRLTRLFYDLDFEEDLTRKTMVEMRPDISGYYKGLLYCRGLEQARKIKKSLDIYLKNIFNDEITSQIKRGCSEFPIKFPEYGKITNDRTTAMNYPSEWKPLEDNFDQNSPIMPKESIMPSISEFCLSDFYIIQKWIDYAKGLGDPSCELFKSQTIVYKEIYDIAAMRKAKYGKSFKEIK